MGESPDLFVTGPFCHRTDLSPDLFVTVLICRRTFCHRTNLSPDLFVTVLICSPDLFVTNLFEIKCCEFHISLGFWTMRQEMGAEIDKNRLAETIGNPYGL